MCVCACINIRSSQTNTCLPDVSSCDIYWYAVHWHNMPMPIVSIMCHSWAVGPKWCVLECWTLASSHIMAHLTFPTLTSDWTGSPNRLFCNCHVCLRVTSLHARACLLHRFCSALYKPNGWVRRHSWQRRNPTSRNIARLRRKSLLTTKGKFLTQTCDLAWIAAGQSYWLERLSFLFLKALHA